LVEQLIRNQQVVGSIPILGSKKDLKSNRLPTLHKFPVATTAVYYSGFTAMPLKFM
jgi:hypothetical protein